MAIAAVRLTAALQHSRERLVTAREEERRRLRRDLHDGLGPALAAHTLKIGSARALLPRNPAAADKLLAELENDIQTALADIRRLVYNLRPPSLDELGLIGAIQPAKIPQVFPELSDREREILNLIAQGYKNAEIATQLVISPKTVRNHITNILSKLQVADRAQTIIRAKAAGLG